MKTSGLPSREDLKEYATQLVKGFRTSEKESADSLNASLTGLEEKLDAAIRRQERFEKKLVKASRRYADQQVAKVVTPLENRIEALQNENSRLKARAETAESELKRVYSIHSEIIELMKEKLPDLYQEFLKRTKA